MNPLETIIREIIAAQGAISLAAYMELALQHPEHGYYRVRKPIGREGDFVTAPEVSQMFGEIVGVWSAETWKTLQRPDPFALIELGPGKGTMMRDLLRATAHVEGFQAAKQLCLIDSDKALRADQRENLGDAIPHYIESIDDAPAMPSLILANEFFDALPVRQFVKTFKGWSEQMVTLGPDGLALAPRLLEPAEMNLIPSALHDAHVETVHEFSPKAQNIMHRLCRRLATQKGALLVIDYGYLAPSGAATVQAVAKHDRADIFDNPGEVDLTAHVDFTALGDIARGADLEVSPVIGQGEFLTNLGIRIRADMLKKRATLPQAAAIDAELHRLIDFEHMGQLFKVMEVRG